MRILSSLSLAPIRGCFIITVKQKSGYGVVHKMGIVWDLNVRDAITEGTQWGNEFGNMHAGCGFLLWRFQNFQKYIKASYNSRTES